MVSNLPRKGDSWEKYTAAESDAIHEPNRPLAGYAILQNKIRFAVAVEVARSSNVPVSRQIR